VVQVEEQKENKMSLESEKLHEIDVQVNINTENNKVLEAQMEANRERQDNINERLTKITEEHNFTLYGSKDNPESGLVYQNRQSSEYIEKKLNSKSEIITYVTRTFIILILLWLVKNIATIATLIENIGK